MSDLTGQEREIDTANEDISYLPPKQLSSQQWARRHWRHRLLLSLLIMLSDMVALGLVFVLIRSFGLKTQILLYRTTSQGLEQTPTGIDWFLLLASAILLVAYLKGHYIRRRPIWNEIPELLPLIFILAGADLIMLSLANTRGSWELILASWIILAVLLPIGRTLTKAFLLKIGLWQTDTVVVGGDDNVLETVLSLRTERLLGYRVRKIVWLSESPIPDAATEDAVNYGLSLRHVRSDLGRVIEEIGNHHVIVAISNQHIRRFEVLIDELIARSKRVDIIPPLRGMPLAGLAVSHLFGRELIMMHPANNLARPFRRFIKRSFDLITASLLLACLALPIGIIYWRIRREDGGPGFYAQERVGRNGQRFRCLKFRTMHVNAETLLMRWKEQNPDIWQRYVDNNFKLLDDPRVTRIGRFLRRSSLDELPQLLNVLRGEMSLVGPRPLLSRELPFYGRTIQHYNRVLPGITGLWQISGRSHTSFSDRALFDDWYIKNWSLWYDIVILLRTVHVVFGRTGAY